MLIDLLCPVENLKTVVRTNSETGKPYLLLKLFNISEKTITSLDFTVKVFDDAENEIASVPVEFTELNAAPKEFFAENKAIPLEEVVDAKKISIEVHSVTFEGEETPYTPSEENIVDYDDSEASLKDALALRELFPDAVCYASEHDNYWRCACGRPNTLDSDSCVRCATAKEDALKKLSSKSALNEALKEKEEQEKSKAEELIKVKAAKKQKKKKILIISGIVIVALALLALAGYFINGALRNHRAEKLVNEGNYLEAYKLFSELDDDRKYDIQHHVMGNTPENLFYSLGYSAEDKENLYFIARDSSAQNGNLIKENKNSKEQTILTDAAANCLNVVGDYIYFINYEELPCRMTKDGRKTDILMDTPVRYMCVVGCDMYYIKADFDNPENLSYEQCKTLAMQGQMDYYIRLHKMNLNSKKDILVSEEEMESCSIYNKRIYYLSYNTSDTGEEIAVVKSMSMKGTDIKVHVSEPVYMFLIHNEELIYLSYTELHIKKINLKTGETGTLTSENDMVMYMGLSGDSLLYASFNREQYMEYVSGGNSNNSTPVPALTRYDLNTKEAKIIMNIPIDTFNVSGDQIICDATSNLIRVKTDGSECDVVYSDGTSNPPEKTEVETELTPDLQELYESAQ